MAVQLYLNDKEVIMDSSQDIKIVRENPYFSLSDSYTLDVSLPLNILQNLAFFGPLQRIDKRKVCKEYSCRLLSGNVVLIEGIARIVQSNELAVKIQIAKGVSAMNMSSAEENVYIDSIDLGRLSVVDTDITMTYADAGAASCEAEGIALDGYFVPIYETESGETVNTAQPVNGQKYVEYLSGCPSLTSVAVCIAKHFGYDLNISCLPHPCYKMYIVSAIQGDIRYKLPHWTVKEFFTEFVNFFGCAIKDEGEKKLRLVPLNDYIYGDNVEINPTGEHQTDYSKEDETTGVINSNIEYDMETYDTEIIDEEILSQAMLTKHYTAYDAMYNDFLKDALPAKMKTIYNLSGEMYIGWVDEQKVYSLRRIAPFNRLNRFDGAGTVTLKISPAYIEEDCDVKLVQRRLYGTQENLDVVVPLNLPSATNEEGLTHDKVIGPSGIEDVTLQNLVEGLESVSDNEKKSDHISLVFIDGQTENVGDFLTFIRPMHLAFTDYAYKRQFSSNKWKTHFENHREKWSFSLIKLDNCDFSVGHLHELSFQIDRCCKTIFRFVSSVLPDPSNIFVINGKRFACEKIEANIRNGVLDKLMTGYFYEFQS